MWVELVRVGLTSVGALAVAWVVFTFKEGGRRGVKRRAIREDLELVKLLDDVEHAVAKRRIQARVEVLLRQYEPDEDAVARRRERRLWAAEFAGATTAAVMAVAVFDLTTVWSNLLVGAVLGIGVNASHWLLVGRRDKAEQDEAAQAVSGTVTGTGTITGDADVVQVGEDT